jgi:sugar phosphate isomerase/epimerase
MKPAAGLWHWSPAGPGPARLSGLDELCKRARRAGLDYISFKALDGAQDRFLTDSQLSEAKRACARAGLEFSLWQYVYAVRPPREEAQSFAKLIERFKPTFVLLSADGKSVYVSSSKAVVRLRRHRRTGALKHPRC